MGRTKSRAATQRLEAAKLLGAATAGTQARTQLTVVAATSVLALITGLFAPANVNMSLSARDVGGLIMPPGMIMTRDTPAGAMRDMAAQNPNLTAAAYTTSTRGGQTLQPVIVDGVKTFHLTASPIRWEIYPGRFVDAYAHNGRVPGPRPQLVQGDRLRITVINRLDQSTTVHWHGLDVPNSMDGPANITQAPIEPGKNHTYSFTVTQWGTYFYHSHDHADRQQGLGLYGAIIVAPKDPRQQTKSDLDYTVQVGEWLERDGLTYPAMPMEGGLANYFTINGKSYPATDTLRMQVGQTIRIRFVGSDSVGIHPMHIHRGPFTVVAIDGNELQPSQPYHADTVLVGPGQRYDVILTALPPGSWLIHCHINHHTTNNNVETDGAGGLTMVLKVTA